MEDRKQSTFFSGAHAAKDSGIALALAQQQGLHLPLLAASKAQYDQMIRAGLGEIDKSGISELTFRFSRRYRIHWQTTTPKSSPIIQRLRPFQLFAFFLVYISYYYAIQVRLERTG